MEAEGEWEEEEKRGGASRDRPLQGEGEQRIEQPVEGEGQEAEEEEGGWQAEESSPVIPLQCHSPGQVRGGGGCKGGGLEEKVCVWVGGWVCVWVGGEGVCSLNPVLSFPCSATALGRWEEVGNAREGG